MNILILNWRDPRHPLAGGAEVTLLEYAKYWQKKGAQITWFASEFENSKQTEKKDGITYVRKGSHYTVHFWTFWLYITGKLPKYDVVVDCFHFLPFFTPLYMKQSYVVGMIHEVAKDVWFKNLPWVFAFIGSCIEPYFFKLYKSRPFITVSESTKKDLSEIGIPSSQIHVIHNGVRVPMQIKKYSKTSTPVILYLGRIADDKGIKDAIQAYETLFKEHQDVEFWVAGKEEKKGTFKKLAFNKKGKIRYFGFVPEDKKWELFQKAWILVHPSTREGWGLTVIEANSMETPVVGYDVAGLRDSIQNRETGLLVKPNGESLAEGVLELLENKKLYQKLSQNAKNWAQEFSWEKAGRESWTIINKKSLV